MPGYKQNATLYDSAEWTQGVSTNYDVSAQTLFVNCKNPTWVSVRTDTTLTVKFNSTTAPAITINANTEFVMDFQFHHMYLTTTGDSAVKIVFTQTDPA
jgi:hypothetical protein